MLKVGITGGIGSGKTTICKIFEALGIPVYYADERAKWLMSNDPDLIENLKMTFGENVYTKEGALNRTYLANIVFKDQTQLEVLNKIVHPAVGIDGEKWHHAQKDVPFTLKEAALFFENGSDALMDRMITVIAPDDIRINRVVKRDKTNPEAVKARMSKQLPQDYKAAHSHYVIDNSGQHSLVKQVWEIYKDLIQLNKNKMESKQLDE